MNRLFAFALCLMSLSFSYASDPLQEFNEKEAPNMKQLIKEVEDFASKLQKAKEDKLHCEITLNGVIKQIEDCAIVFAEKTSQVDHTDTFKAIFKKYIDDNYTLKRKYKNIVISQDNEKEFSALYQAFLDKLCNSAKVNKNAILLNSGFTGLLSLDLPFSSAKMNCERADLNINHFAEESKKYTDVIKEIEKKLNKLKTPLYQLYEYLNSSQL